MTGPAKDPYLADVHDDDRNCDPVDLTKPSSGAHATVDDFSGGYRGPNYKQPLPVPHDGTQEFAVILQGLLSNMSIDPLAVEKNTSLAAQYIDAMHEKLEERQQQQEDIRRKQYEVEMEDMVGPTGFPRPLFPPGTEDYIQIIPSNDEQ